MVTDNYRESPYYNPNSVQMVYTGKSRSTETPYGVPRGNTGMVYVGPGHEDSYGATKHAGQNYSFTPDLSYMFAQSGSGNTGGGVKGMFNNLKNKASGLFAPGTGTQFSAFTDKLMSPQFSWNTKSGLQGWGKNLGKGATMLGGLYYGLDAAQGLKDYSDATADLEELMSDIVSASYNNPMLMYDLDSEQQKLLRQLRRGAYSTDLDTNEMDLMGVLGGAAKGGLTGLVGGIPGAIVGALGGGANAYIDEMNRVQGLSTAELEALYEAVLASEQQNNAMKKQQMLQSGLYY